MSVPETALLRPAYLKVKSSTDESFHAMQHRFPLARGRCVGPTHTTLSTESTVRLAASMPANLFPMKPEGIAPSASAKGLRELL